jgi:hypothetical protein
LNFDQVIILKITSFLKECKKDDTRVIFRITP